MNLVAINLKLQVLQKYIWIISAIVTVAKQSRNANNFFQQHQFFSADCALVLYHFRLTPRKTKKNVALPQLHWRQNYLFHLFQFPLSLFSRSFHLGKQQQQPPVHKPVQLDRKNRRKLDTAGDEETCPALPTTPTLPSTPSSTDSPTSAKAQKAPADAGQLRRGWGGRGGRRRGSTKGQSPSRRAADEPPGSDHRRNNGRDGTESAAGRFQGAAPLAAGVGAQLWFAGRLLGSLTGCMRLRSPRVKCFRWNVSGAWGRVVEVWSVWKVVTFESSFSV